MRVVIDDKIPFIRDIFEPYGEVDYRDGAAINAAAVREADALVIRTRTRCDAALLEGSRVRLVATATIGYDHIDMDYCQAQEIEVVTAAGCNARGVTQWVFAALQALGAAPQTGTLGIIGVGHVGSVVREVAQGAGFTVLCCDPPRQRRGEPGTEDFVTQAELLQHADIVTLHVPLDQTTRGLASNAFFEAMKPGALLLNSSRGEVIDETALIDKLKRYSLKAVLDVWSHEPNIDRELLALTTIATPHIAGYTLQGKAMGTAMSVRSVARFFGLPIAPDWYPAGVPGQTPRADLTWQDLVTEMPRHYHILADDRRLRESPGTFEGQRSGYDLRTEFF